MGIVSRNDLWKGSFACDVEGLEYQYPFNIGDVVYSTAGDEERSKRFPMKVIEVGVPVPVNVGYEKKMTPHGRQGHFRTDDGGNYVEGVRVQHVWFEGDKGHGHKENLRTSNLKKMDNFKTQLDRYNEWKEKEILGENK